MKKILMSALAAFMLFAFGCSKPAETITIEKFANATPENAEIFIAYQCDKKFMKDYLSQKGAKDFLRELAKNEVLQKAISDFLTIFMLEDIITPESINQLITSISETDEDSFVGFNCQDFKNSFDFQEPIGELVLSSETFVKFVKEALDKSAEKNTITKTEKTNLTLYKAEKAAILIKGNLLVFSVSEEKANALLEAINKPLEKSFAKTQNFTKLNDIKKGADILFFFDANKITEENIEAMYFSGKMNSINDVEGTFKLDLGKAAITNAKEVFENLSKRTLKKGALLKNSISNSSFALGVSIPELSKDLVDFINKASGKSDPEFEMFIQMAKSINIKGLYFSCGELKVEQILKIQETMQPPEMFLKIDCENSDAFFKNPMMVQMLNSPFVSQMQVGENTIYTTMANVKFSQAGKEGALISTITDLAKTTNLAKSEGETLASNKDAKTLMDKLPDGNFIEIFIDNQKLESFIKEINNITMGESNKIENAFYGIYKKSLAVAAVKIEGTSIIINFCGVQEVDFEKAIKQLKELK